ncbi:GHMP kinase [Flavobacterium sp. GSP27]|uniref:GYDIA family GHMP kinase n=1 Tax=unclassified Flavobacterium TaxID=196869 RepID=UPI000F846277|nr:MULTISPECIES: GYDIA family GHMP kinase [unclassified Flavobacterium]RTY65839.1 GHMP kinase [Flavobacterium sp. LB2P53]RTY89793.1 GHMP kinase [Flavobacterium sp. RSP46]RTY93573.1 GHMP kinase [Flavobacterium sp. GSN2]RTZ08298.1 GHMP kinase [Flavobacterium sp. GSP27]
MKKTFYSNGKLLITGEYLVLDGAKAFALPTKMGQNLIIEKGNNKEIIWKSYDADGSIWFEDTLLFSDISKEVQTKNESVKATLKIILHEAFKLNPGFILNSEGYTITTELSFPKSWGLGTSSTLINNIAQWLDIDAFTLLKNSFGGSGYDIACAQNDTPIVYHLEKGTPIVEKVSFNPDFTNNLYFVYLNKKQSSKSAITAYDMNKKNNLPRTIALNDVITSEVLNATTIQSFAAALQKHEVQMSIVLETQTIKESLFPDFNGVIKSLGAWGGDFVMAIAIENPTDYFISKGYETIIFYDEMILP